MSINLFYYNGHVDRAQIMDLIRNILMSEIRGDVTPLASCMLVPALRLYDAFLEVEEKETKTISGDEEIYELYCEVYWKAICKANGEQYRPEMIHEHDGNMSISYQIQDALSSKGRYVPRWVVADWARFQADYDVALGRALRDYSGRYAAVKADHPDWTHDQIDEQAG